MAQRVIAQNLVVYILVGSPVDLELIEQSEFHVSILRMKKKSSRQCSRDWNPDTFQNASISPMEDELIHHFASSQFDAQSDSVIFVVFEWKSDVIIWLATQLFPVKEFPVKKWFCRLLRLRHYGSVLPNGRMKWRSFRRERCFDEFG